MINYELLEAIQANKIMKKEEKINKALLLIEQLTNKKPVLKEIKSEPVTKQVVEEAMRIVSKDVLAPKVVRDGLLKETVEKPIKRRFYAVTDDFEKQAKRLIAFYNDMLVLHPELKSEANKVKRALGSIEGSFTNTEMFINENKKEEQLELDLKEETSTVENVSPKKYKYIDKNLEGRHLTKLVRALDDQDLEKYIQRINDHEAILTIPTNESEAELFNDVVEFAVGKHNLVLTEDVTPIKNERDFVKLWWDDLHPFECVELGRKYFPDKHYSDITKEDIQVIFDNEVTNKKGETLTEDIAGMTTASMAAFDGGLGIKPASKKKLKEAYSNSIVTAGDTVDTKYGKLVILSSPVFGRSKYKIPVMSLNTFNSLATTKRVETSNVPVEFLTVSAGWMAAVKPGLKVPTEHLKKVWNLYVGKRDEITVKKSEIKQKKFDAAAPLINWSNEASGYVVTMVDGNTAKVGDKVDVRFSNGIFSGTIKSIAGRGDGAVGILFRGRTKAKMVAPKIILKRTERI